MPSTYSSNLKIELMSTGENSGTWGNITNTNLGTALEQAVVGYGAVSYASDANLTISITNSNAAQAARALVLNVTSAVSLTGTRELVVPTIEKQYIVQNNTTGSQSITVKTSAGTGITVPNGRKAHLYVDGTNVIQMFDFVDINGGTIDGTPIGGSSAAAGSFTTLGASGAATFNGAVTLGDAAADLIVFNGTVNSHLLFTDNTYDIGASGATRPRNLFLAGAATIGGNLSVGGTLTLTGGVNLNGNVTVGDNATDTLTINSTITSNLIFTDNTYDIGASGATRPRNLFLAGNATIGGNQTLTGSLTVDSTTDSSSITTGSIQTDGGLGVAKALYVGTSVNIGGLTASKGVFTDASKNLTSTGTLGTDQGGTGLTSFTANRVFYASSTSAVAQSANLTFDGTTLTAANFADSSLTSGRVVYAGASGNLTDNSALTFDTSTLLINATNTSYRGQLSLQGGASDFAQITFYRGGTTNTDQVGYVHSLNTASGSQSMVIGARNGAFLKFDVGDAEQARISATTGNLLVGTSTEINDSNLKVQLNVTPSLTQRFFSVNNNGDYGLIMGFLYNDQANIRTVWNYPLVFGTNNAERARFTPTGEFLVGTTTANAKVKLALTSPGTLGTVTNVGSFGPGGVLSLGGVTNNTDGVYFGTGDTGGTGVASGIGFLREASGWNSAVAFYTNNVTSGPNGVSAIREVGKFTSAGELLVGATSLASGFSGIAQIQASGSNGGIIINSSSTGASDYSRLIFTKGNANGNEGLIRYNTNDYHMAFWTNATEKARITSGGNLFVNRTSGQNNGKLEVLADSGGQAIVAQVQTNGNSLFQGFAAAGGSAVFQVTGNGDGYLSGVLGVGMSPNLTQLDVRQNTTYAFGINNSGGTRNYSWRIDSGTDALVLGTRTTSTDLVTVTTNGDLLVGTSSSSGRLTVVNTAGAQAALFSCGSGTTQQAVATFSNTTNGGYLSIAGVGTSSAVGTWTNGSMVVEGVPFSSGNTFIGSYTGDLVFQNGRNNSGRFTSAGNFVVGAATASGSTQTGWVFLRNWFGAGDDALIIGHAGAASGDPYMAFNYNGSAIGTITQNGTTAVAYNTSSDYRLKNVTGPVTTSGSYIDSLKPVEGTWKSDGSTFVGLIAHEVQEVSRTQIATGVKDGERMQGMDYSNSEFIANIIAELQSLRKRVAQLEQGV